MLRLPPFRFRAPRSLADAAATLAGEGAGAGEPVRLVAGGTDLWPNLKRRHQRASTVVSLLRLPELRGIANGGGELRLGATATLTAVAAHPAVRSRYPALARAVESISTPVLRQMGTIGGNLCLDTRCTYYNQNEEWRQAIGYCMKAQGKICWVAPSSPRCWAIQAADSAPILIALGARIRLVSAGGERVIPVADLYRDDGIDYLVKQPDEILTQVLLPLASDADHCRASFHKLRRRGSIDFAVLSVAVAAWTDPAGVVERARVVLGAVASRPVAAPEAEAALLGRPLSHESIQEAAALARQAATPMDNTDFHPQWRGEMVERYTLRALTDLLAP